MMKSLILILAPVAFMACSPVPQELTDKVDPGTMVDKTQTTSCTGSSPVNATVYRSWHTDLESANGDKEQRTMTVEGNAVGMTTVCKYGSTQVSVTARVNASVTPNTIQTTSHDSQEVTTNANGKTRVCSANIDSNVIMTYTFQGPCLKVTTSGQSQLMLP